MSQTTISVQNSGSYDKIQIAHDNRKKDENGKPFYSRNVDSSLSENNWYWEGNMTIKEFYEKEFEEFFCLQTEKIRATHPERLEGRASSYFEQILGEQLEGEKLRDKLKLEGLTEKEINKKMSAISKVAYQTIIQFGDRDSEFGTLNGTAEGREIAKKVMREFIDKWQRENPHMKFINVAIHADEVGADGKGGTIHAHITYCPVCTSYKKGMSVRNSLTGALKEMGYETDKKKDPVTGEFHFAIEKWQQAMRDELEQMLAVYGYSRLVPEDTRTGHESIADYGKRKDQLRKIEEHSKALEQREENVLAMENKIEDRRQRLNATIASEKARVDGEDERLTQREQHLDARESEIEEQGAILQAEAEESVLELKKTIAEATENIKHSPGKQLEDYSRVPMKKGHRAVPEKDLEVMIDRSWITPSYIKDTVSKVIDKFNELPFVKKARSTIQNLEEQIFRLRKKVMRLEERNKEQQVLLDKAKEIPFDSKRTVYDILKKEVERDRQRAREEQSIADDILD